MKRSYTLVLILFIAFLVESQTNASRKTHENQEVILLHTNDIHGQINNFPRLAFVVDSVRKIHENVFLLNAGDLFSGNPIIDMYEDKGFPIIDLMNRTGFNVSAFGNHEFDYGQKILKKRIEQAHFPFICANLINESSLLKSPKAFIKLKTKNNLKINILSIVDNSANGLPETHPAKLKGLKFSDPILTASKYKKLTEKNNLFIALTHIGIDNDIILAQKMPEIDVIIGGHSHSLIDSLLMVNGVLIAQVGSKLKSVGEIKLIVNNGKIIDKSFKIINLQGKNNVDNGMRDLIHQYNDNKMLKEVLAKAKVKLSGNEEIGCFYTDALRNSKNLDIVFQNSGGIRINEIPEGEITLETVYRMDPFGNYLMSINLNPDEIRSLIRFSFRDGKIDLRVSGINYTIVKENNAIKEIILTDYQGIPIDENKTYSVGMNDYIINTYNFQHLEKPMSQGVTTAEVIIDYLKKVGEFDYSGTKRTFLKDLDAQN